MTDEDQKLQKREDDAPRFPFKDICPSFGIAVGSYAYKRIIRKKGVRPNDLLTEEEFKKIVRIRHKSNRR
jgi:hypothetical protein